MKKNLRVLHVIAAPFPANQGSAGAARELLCALSKRGHEIHVVTYYQGQDDIDLPDINIHRIPKLGNSKNLFVGFNFLRPFLDSILSIKTLKVALKINPHVIHCHHHESVIANFLTKRLTKIPTLYHCQASMEQELPLYLKPEFLFTRLGGFLDNLAPKMADCSIAVSKDLTGVINKEVNMDCCTYLPLAVDFKKFSYKSSSGIARKFNLNDKKIVLYTGVVDQFQGIEELLDSMVFVFKEIANAHLVLAIPISSKNQISKYKKIACDLKINDRVLFLEDLTLSDLPCVLSCADVTVIPRKYCPGFPIKLINYIASKKPVVAMEGSAKIIKDGQSGLVAKNYEEFRQKITKILVDPELGNKLASNAIKLLDRFAPETVSKQVEDIYLRLIRKD